MQINLYNKLFKKEVILCMKIFSKNHKIIFINAILILHVFEKTNKIINFII